MVAQTGKNLHAMRKTRVQPLGREGPLEKGMATRSNMLAWRIPWAEEPGGLQSVGSPGVGHGCSPDTFPRFSLPERAVQWSWTVHHGSPVN